jgi:hypothetical protein
VIVAMVAASAARLAVIAGAIAIPAGIGLDRALFVILGTDAGGNGIPAAVYEVLPPGSCWRYRWPQSSSRWRRH